MDLDFGHGFIPRIGSQNYKAIDRCLGPDTLFDTPVDLPWAIVDAPWAEKNPEFLGSLYDHGTKVLLDDSGWRYRYAPTFEVATMAKASWAPPEPISVTDSESVGRYVREALRCQAKLGAAAYQVPGFMPDHKQDDLRPAYDALASILRTFDELPPKPLVLFVGAHSSSLAMTHALLDELPGLSGLYMQVGPSAPVVDSPTKLLRLTELCFHAKALGVSVIAGHSGGVIGAMRAAGIDAADAGLASSEAFEPSSKRRPKPPKDPDKKQSGGPSSRAYLDALGRSFAAGRVKQIRSVAAARDLVSGCRLACHRLIGGDVHCRSPSHQRPAGEHATQRDEPATHPATLDHHGGQCRLGGGRHRAGRHAPDRQPPQLDRASRGEPIGRVGRSSRCRQ